MQRILRVTAVAGLAVLGLTGAGCTSFALGSSVHYHFYPCRGHGQGRCRAQAQDATATDAALPLTTTEQAPPQEPEAPRAMPDRTP